MSKCQCTMSKSVLGEGCRYCQPQEYIDKLHDQIVEEIKESEEERSELLKALTAVSAILLDPRIRNQVDESILQLVGKAIAKATNKESEG